MRRFTAIILLMLSAAGCVSNFAPAPEGAQIGCRTDADCPTGWMCNAAAGMCASPNELKNPPKLLGDPALAPQILKLGATTVLSFEASKDLISAPEVTVKLSGNQRLLSLDEKNSSGRKYVFTYTAAGDEPQNIESPVSIVLTDKYGVKSGSIAAGSIKFDFLSPAISESAVTGSPATTGKTVAVEFNVNKTLKSDPVVSFGSIAGARHLSAEASAKGDAAPLPVGSNVGATRWVALEPNVCDVGARHALPMSSGSSERARQRLAPTFEKDPSSAGLHFKYTYTVTGTETQNVDTPIVVDLEDEAGNTASGLEAGKARFDFVKPSFVGDVFISPKSVTEMGSVTVMFEADKSLSDAGPVVSIGGILMSLYSRDANKYVYKHIAEAADGEGKKVLYVKMTDLAGNETELKDDPSKSVLFDFTRPAVKEGPFLNKPSGYYTVGDKVGISFGANKEMLVEEIKVSLRTETPVEMPCAFGGKVGDSFKYDCITQNGLSGSEKPQGPANIAVELSDSAGNKSYTSAGLYIDFTPPGIAAGAYSNLISNFPENPIISVTALTNGTTVVANFSVSEELAADSPAPYVVICKTSGCDPKTAAQVIALDIDQSGSTGKTYRFTKKVTALDPNLDFTSNLYLVPGPSGGIKDLAGNEQTAAVQITTVKVNTTQPGTPSIANVYYRRVPWGQRDENKNFVEKNFTVVCNACQFGANVEKVLIYDSVTPSSGGLIGEAPNPHTGSAWSFDKIKLNGSDRAHIWMATADSAGNISPATEIKSAEWIATMGYKVPGSAVENPHIFINVGISWPTFLQDTYVTEPEVFKNNALFKASQYGMQAWINSTPLEEIAVPPARSEHALAYDSARGRTVLFGGTDGTNNLNDIWEWDGTTWTQKVPANSPPARSEHALVYDSARGKVVSFGGMSKLYHDYQYHQDTWEWDGTNWLKKSLATSPPARWGHALAFDSVRGRTVLFGGYGSSSILNDTWEWDGTNWTQGFPATSPPARSSHALAYDSVRGKVVLFGGSGSSGILNETWEWDGTNWTKMNPATNPSARTGHAMAYDSARGKVVLFGGSLGGNETWEWDGTNWTLLNPSTEPPGRERHGMTYDNARGKVVLFGGNGGTNDLNDTWEWDGTNWTRMVPVVVSPPSWYGSALAYDSVRGRAVVFGGNLNDTWEWDGTNWTKMNPATNPSARTWHAMAYDRARGRMVLFGGNGGTNDLNDTWEWDGTNWTQKFPSASPQGRENHALAYDSARGKVVLFGGYDGTNRFNDTWEWDGTNWTQKVPVINPPVRYGHALAYDSSRGKVVLFGGYDGTNRFNDTWEWDGTNWTQKVPAASPPARKNHALAYDSARSRTVLFGGYGSWYLDDTWEWDGANWTQKVPAASPPARWVHALAYDSARGRTVLFGNDIWEWDGTNWSKRSSDTSPPVRERHALVYDSVRGKVVLFGGVGSRYLNDTWEWDGTNWTQGFPATSPPARSSHALAYDNVRGKVVLFGGTNDLNDTWEWDGTNWTQKFPSASPQGRENHALAYDSTRGRTVLFGGTDGTNDLNDTWEWDGANWTQGFPATSPPARMGHALAYDSARGRAVLFGGAGSWYLNDTWEWDGTNWTQGFPATSPPARLVHALAYDSVRGRTVLFGGDGSSGSLNDTWEWDGTTWTQKVPAYTPPVRYRHSLAYDSIRDRIVLFGGGSGSSSLNNDTWELNGGGSGNTMQTAKIAIMSTGVLRDDPKARMKQIDARINSGGSGFPWDNVKKHVNPTYGVNLMAWYDNEWHTVASNSDGPKSPGLVVWNTTDEKMIWKLLYSGGMNFNFAVVPQAPNGFGHPNCPADWTAEECDMGMVSTEYVEVTLRYELP